MRKAIGKTEKDLDGQALPFHPNGLFMLGVLFRLFHRANYAQKVTQHSALGYIGLPSHERLYEARPHCRRYMTPLLVRPTVDSQSEMKQWDDLRDFSTFVTNITDYHSQVATHLSVGWEIIQYLQNVSGRVFPGKAYRHQFVHGGSYLPGCPVMCQEEDRIRRGVMGPGGEVDFVLDHDNYMPWDVPGEHQAIVRTVIKERDTPTKKVLVEAETLPHDFWNTRKFPLDEPGRYFLKETRRFIW